MSRRTDQALIALLTLALLAPALPSIASPPENPCGNALPFDVEPGVEGQTVVHQGRAFGAPSDLIEVHVPRNGILDLEAIAALGTVPVRLYTVDAPCTLAGTAEWVRLREAPARLRLRFQDAGSIFVEIAPEDPSATLSEYALHAFFQAPPGGPTVPQAGTLRWKVDPIEDDEESGLTGGTPLQVDVPVDGVIDNSSGVDVDTYTFSLQAQTTVELDVVGTAGIEAILFDGADQRLDTWSGSLVRTLVAGDYRLHVGSTATWGEYTVTLTVP